MLVWVAAAWLRCPKTHCAAAFPQSFCKKKTETAVNLPVALMSPSQAATKERLQPAHRTAAPARAKPVEHVPAKDRHVDKGPTHAEIRAIVVGLMLAMFLAALNQTIVAKNGR